MTLEARAVPRGATGARSPAFLASAARAAAVVVVAALAAGCTTTPLQSPNTPTASAQLLPASATGTQPLMPYVFGIGDEFDVRVPDATQLESAAKVRPDGKVSLPLIGSLYVQGRTPDDVQAELRERMHALGGAPGTRDYLLQPNDEIEVKFPYTPAFNEVQKLRPDGKIQMQMVGTVDAQGLSPEELQQRLKTLYGHVLRKPELSVIVRSVTTQNIRVATADGIVVGRAGLGGLQPTIVVRAFATPQVFVTGEVGKPGVLGFTPGLTLVQAIIEAGGALPTGDAMHIVILRRGAGAPGQPDAVQVLRLDLPKDFGRQPDRDVALQPLDIVVLPRSDVSVLGDNLNQYLFNILPVLKNSSFGLSYQLNNTAIVR